MRAWTRPEAETTITAKPARATRVWDVKVTSTITMPAAGVVCDGTNQLCYDRDGLSLQLRGT